MPNKQIPDLTKATVITDNGGVPTQHVGGITEYAQWDLIYNYVKNRIISENQNLGIGDIIIRTVNEQNVLPLSIKLDGIATVVKAEYPAFNDYVIANASIMVGTEPYKWKDLGDSWQTPNLAGMLLAPSGVYNEDNTDKGIALGAYKSDAMQRYIGTIETSLGIPLLQCEIDNNGVLTTTYIKQASSFKIVAGYTDASGVQEISVSNLNVRYDTYTHNRTLGVNYYMVIANYITTKNLESENKEIIQHVETIKRVMNKPFSYYLAEYVSDNVMEVQPNKEVNLLDSFNNKEPKLLKGFNYHGKVAPHGIVTYAITNKYSTEPTINEVLTTKLVNTMHITVKLTGKWDNPVPSRFLVTLSTLEDNIIATRILKTSPVFNATQIVFDYIVANVDTKEFKILIKNLDNNKLTISYVDIIIKGE